MSTRAFAPAEVCAREAKNPTRAAELFREVQRIPGVTVGEDICVSNRLVDLLTGPLADRGKAMGELRGASSIVTPTAPPPKTHAVRWCR